MGPLFHELPTWLRWISLGVFKLLELIHVVIPNWGLAIIGLAVIIKIVFYPLSQKALVSQKKFTAIQKNIGPELANIKKTLKGAEQSEAILELYKKNGVSPLAGVKPLLILLLQLPVFMALYQVLIHVPDLKDASFLWMKSLAEPDRLMTFGSSIPVFGNSLNLLPVLMTVSTLLSMKMAPAPASDPKAATTQNIFMLLMAVTFLVVFYPFPSGVVLYWTTSNVLQLLQSLFLNQKTVVPAEAAQS